MIDLRFLGAPELAEWCRPASASRSWRARYGTATSTPKPTAPRLFSDLLAGELLMMPTELGGYAGVKVVTVAPGNLDRREIPAALTLRSDIVVEGRGSAMREAGNLIPARSEEEWAQHPLTNLAELVSGSFVRHPGRPALYSGVGMAWQDIVVAAHVYARARRRRS